MIHLSENRDNPNDKQTKKPLPQKSSPTGQKHALGILHNLKMGGLQSAGPPF